MNASTQTQTLPKTFEDMGLNPALLQALASENYTTPTPIQAQSIPGGVTGRGLLGIAQARTGSGKTAAFDAIGRYAEAENFACVFHPRKRFQHGRFRDDFHIIAVGMHQHAIQIICAQALQAGLSRSGWGLGRGDLFWLLHLLIIIVSGTVRFDRG